MVTLLRACICAVRARSLRHQQTVGIIVLFQFQYLVVVAVVVGVFFRGSMSRFLFGFSFIACMHMRYTSLLFSCSAFSPSLFLFCMLCAQVNNLQIWHVIRLIRDFYCTNDCFFLLLLYFFVIFFSSSFAFRRRNIVLGRYLPTMLIILLQAMH